VSIFFVFILGFVFLSSVLVLFLCVFVWVVHIGVLLWRPSWILEIKLNEMGGRGGGGGGGGQRTNYMHSFHPSLDKELKTNV